MATEDKKAETDTKPPVVPSASASQSKVCVHVMFSISVAAFLSGVFELRVFSWEVLMSYIHMQLLDFLSVFLLVFFFVTQFSICHTLQGDLFLVLLFWLSFTGGTSETKLQPEIYISWPH